MKYPVISTEELERLASELLDGTSADVHNSVKWVGSEPAIDVAPIVEAAEQISAALARHQAGDKAGLQDLLEGQVSGILHAALAELPIEVLDDPGFWRYLAAAHLWEFITWREAKTFEKDWTKYRKYIDGTRNAECVPLRMYLRGGLSRTDEGDYALASAVERGTDLWRSHVLRIRVSYSSTVTQGVVRQVADHQIATDELRSYAKRITRLGSNVVLPMHDDESMTQLLDELRTTSSGPRA